MIIIREWRELEEEFIEVYINEALIEKIEDDELFVSEQNRETIKGVRFNNGGFVIGCLIIFESGRKVPSTNTPQEIIEMIKLERIKEGA